MVFQTIHILFIATASMFFMTPAKSLTRMIAKVRPAPNKNGATFEAQSISSTFPKNMLTYRGMCQLLRITHF